MYIEAEVPENYLTTVTAGKKVRVTFPILEKTIAATVRQVGYYINPGNRSFKIEIAIPNKDKDIKPNLTAKLNINDYTNKEAILIPQNLISENAAGQQYVYLATNKNNKNQATALRAIIKAGKTQDDFIEVLKGIKSGDLLIEEGARSVREGQEVQIIE